MTQRYSYSSPGQLTSHGYDGDDLQNNYSINEQLLKPCPFVVVFAVSERRVHMPSTDFDAERMLGYISLRIFCASVFDFMKTAPRIHGLLSA